MGYVEHDGKLYTVSLLRSTAKVRYYRTNPIYKTKDGPFWRKVPKGKVKDTVLAKAQAVLDLYRDKSLHDQGLI
jgi:hypothetical protein